MVFNLDLHAHSRSAMSTKKATSLSLETVNATMPSKGIHVIGTGDCHFEPWFGEIRQRLVQDEDHSGILFLPSDPKVGFVLQTEIIFTAECRGKRKQVHVIILFPHYNAVKSFISLLKKWEVKIGSIPRPYVKCQNNDDVSARIMNILEIDSMIEFIPAHIMTPTGVFGSNIRINRLEQFFGEAEKEIHAVETGLSADPRILSMIPELDNKTLISNSDAHCADLHRLGREFFSINANHLSYETIIGAIRNNKITRTAEFPPQEGRYFLTGHRGGRWKPKRDRPTVSRKSWHTEEEFCLYSPNKIPEGDICPICKRILTVGVLQRAYELAEAQGSPERTLNNIDSVKKPFRTIIPLVEVTALALGIKNPMAKRVISEYYKIINLFGNEANFWFHPNPEKICDSTISPKLTTTLLQVHSGQFSFWLPGFDGIYGSLELGKKREYLNISIVAGRDSK